MKLIIRKKVLCFEKCEINLVFHKQRMISKNYNNLNLSTTEEYNKFDSLSFLDYIIFSFSNYICICIWIVSM